MNIIYSRQDDSKKTIQPYFFSPRKIFLLQISSVSFIYLFIFLREIHFLSFMFAKAMKKKIIALDQGGSE